MSKIFCPDDQALTKSQYEWMTKIVRLLGETPETFSDNANMPCWLKWNSLIHRISQKSVRSVFLTIDKTMFGV